MYIDDTEDTGDTGTLPDPIVTIYLVDSAGQPIDDGMIVGLECGVWRWIGPDGVASFSVQPGVCAFQGRRRDGLLWGRSEWLEEDLAPGDEVEIELVVPIERTGGLGVAIREHELGIEVQKVWPGTPAWEMGLEAGDIIVEVDGLPALALGMDDFIEVMTGPVGTTVDFAVAWEVDTGLSEEDMTLTRAWLSD